MRINIEKPNWKSELLTFNQRNEQRPTSLEVMGPGREAESDYWLEGGLLFQGVDLDLDCNRDLYLDIMLQAQTGNTRNHMTHNVTSVRRINLEMQEGRDQRLEIEDATGALTILRFETRRPQLN